MPKLSFWITFSAVMVVYSGVVSIIKTSHWIYVVFMSVNTACFVTFVWLLKQEHKQAISSTEPDTDFLPRLNPKAQAAFHLFCWVQNLLGIPNHFRNEQDFDNCLVWQLNNPGKKRMHPLLPLLVITAFIVPTAFLLYTSPYPYLGPLLIAAYATAASGWIYWKS
jgi:hypothetical protein